MKRILEASRVLAALEMYQSGSQEHVGRNGRLTCIDVSVEFHLLESTHDEIRDFDDTEPDCFSLVVFCTSEYFSSACLYSFLKPGVPAEVRDLM